MFDCDSQPPLPVMVNFTVTALLIYFHCIFCMDSTRLQSKLFKQSSADTLCGKDGLGLTKAVTWPTSFGGFVRQGGKAEASGKYGAEETSLDDPQGASHQVALRPSAGISECKKNYEPCGLVV